MKPGENSSTSFFSPSIKTLPVLFGLLGNRKKKKDHISLAR